MHLANYQPKSILPDVPDLGRSAYDKGLALFIKFFFKDLSGYAAIYQFGKIRTLGISDIDLLIIVEDAEWKRSRQKAKSIINSSDLLNLLFLHEPAIIGISVLESFQKLHTLENCKFIYGTWNPVSDKSLPSKNFGESLMSHAAWNSFMRIAALELENAEIGLRRTLVLIHNLLKSAKSGNNFLSNPISIPISSEEIRTNILAQAQEKQESLARKYINEIITILNEVDSHIDAKFKLNSHNIRHHLPIGLGRYFLITFPTRAKKLKGMFLNRLLKGACFVKIPIYLIELTSMVSAEISNVLPTLNRFKILNSKISVQEHDILPYIQHLKKTVKISLEHEIFDYYFLPLPFACQKFKLSLKSKIITKIRERLLSSVLIFDEPDQKLTELEYL